MNKFKLGQKVKVIRTGKIGEIKSIGSEDFDIVGCSNACYKVHYVQEDDWDWFTFHDLESVKEILDAEEKEYLSNVIKPFRGRVTGIKKTFSSINCLIDYEYYFSIWIFLKSIDKKQKYEIIALPAFNREMYKNMKINKEYTLEELGL